MNSLLKVIAVLAIPVALVGALLFAIAGAGLYMVLVQGVAPGEPIWLDELAPSTGEAALRMATGAAAIGAALSLRALIRRKLQR
jgi:hypothetical protein